MIKCFCMYPDFLHKFKMEDILLKMKYNVFEIGKKLKEERKNAGFKSCDALADYIREHNYRGFTRQTISKWECGKEMPPLDVLLSLCERFECELGYLLCEYPNKTRTNTDIHNETGLSEGAINILREWNRISKEKGEQYIWAQNALQALNDLLCQGIILADNILLPMADYMVYRFKYDFNGRKKSDLDKFRLALYTATDGLSECIKNIYLSIGNKKPNDNKG